MSRSEDFFRRLDAKDEAFLRATLADDSQGADEITRGWMRGRAAVEAYFTANLPRLSEIHSTVEQPEVRRWGDVEVETFMLRQSYAYDGTRYEIEAPTTMIWLREGETWKLALEHSIPLSPAP
jgi:ketosteroid isomerase-like protein